MVSVAFPTACWDPPPLRARVNEPIPFYTATERRIALERAGYNMFRLGESDGSEPTIDLLTDSGTGAVWAGSEAARQLGRETYAAGVPWARFSAAFSAATGYPADGLVPTHQGRAAEAILAEALELAGGISVSNGHFDTTRGNILAAGGHPVDLPVELDDEGLEYFGGNLDVPALEKLLTGPDGHRVRCVVMTITNNARGGQPVSVPNMRDVRAVCDDHGLPLLLDAARFAENAWLNIVRDTYWRDYAEPRGIARAFFDLADGCWISLKKDAQAPAGGVIALRDPELAAHCRRQGIRTEGYATYGGMDGRSLEAMATAFRRIDAPLEAGMRDVTDWRVLRARHEQALRLADGLRFAGMRLVEPCGFHPYIDAGALLPTVPAEQFPGQSLAAALWLVGGVRTAELGSLTFGAAAERELVRAAVPRGVYGREHLNYVAHVAVLVVDWAREGGLPGLRLVDGGLSDPLRHFTAELAPIH